MSSKEQLINDLHEGSDDNNRDDALFGFVADQILSWETSDNQPLSEIPIVGIKSSCPKCGYGHQSGEEECTNTGREGSRK